MPRQPRGPRRGQPAVTARAPYPSRQHAATAEPTAPAEPTTAPTAPAEPTTAPTAPAVPAVPAAPAARASSSHGGDAGNVTTIAGTTSTEAPSDTPAIGMRRSGRLRSMVNPGSLAMLPSLGIPTAYTTRHTTSTGQGSINSTVSVTSTFTSGSSCGTNSTYSSGGIGGLCSDTACATGLMHRPRPND